MFVREVKGNQTKRKPVVNLSSRVKCGNCTTSHKESKVTNREKWENPPTNISATVRFITRYMTQVRRLRFFIKRTSDRRFTVTIATDTVRNTASQVMYSDDIMQGSKLRLVRSPMRLPFFPWRLKILVWSPKWRSDFRRVKLKRTFHLILLFFHHGKCAKSIT